MVRDRRHQTRRRSRGGDASGVEETGYFKNTDDPHCTLMTHFPLQSRLPTTYPIATIKEETPHVKTFTFPVSFDAKPGQFLMLWLPGVDEVPMSVALDDGKVTRMTFFDIGDCTRALFGLKEGDLVGLRGPFGTFYEWKPKQHLILVAGGYGAAPCTLLRWKR